MAHSRFQTLTILCVSLSLFAYGCGDDDGGPTGDAGADSGTDGALDDAGSTCGDGTCQADEDDTSCPVDCAAAPECESNEDCDEGWECRDDGACAQRCELETDCDGGSECGGYPLCVDGFCDDAPPTPAADGTECTPEGAAEGVCEGGVCVPLTCGDGTLDEGEQCDDGNRTSFDGCSAACELESAYRVSGLEIADPHLFAPALACADIGVVVNALLNASITTIAEDADYYGVSMVFVFNPLEQEGTGVLTTADCTGELEAPSCTNFTPLFTTTYASQEGGACLEAMVDTTTTGWGEVNTVAGPCFVTAPGSLTLEFSGIQIPLEDAQLAAQFDDDPAASLTNGLLRGFLSEAAAEAVVLPDDLPLVGGNTLSSLLPGGANADDTPRCLTESENGELDTHEGEQGWWFYVNLPTVAPATFENAP